MFVVQLSRVPLAGVPSAPPFTTGAPALPTFTASAVATPVPGVTPAQVVRSASYACTVVPIAAATNAVPVTPAAGSPVQFVRMPVTVVVAEIAPITAKVVDVQVPTDISSVPTESVTLKS